MRQDTHFPIGATLLLGWRWPLMGLAVGDESTLSPELDRAMIRSGLSHLSAVSGSNTSLVCGLALAASNIARTERMQKGRHNIG